MNTFKSQISQIQVTEDYRWVTEDQKRNRWFQTSTYNSDVARRNHRWVINKLQKKSQITIDESQAVTNKLHATKDKSKTTTRQSQKTADKLETSHRHITSSYIQVTANYRQLPTANLRRLDTNQRQVLNAVLLIWESRSSIALGKIISLLMCTFKGFA